MREQSIKATAGLFNKVHSPDEFIFTWLGYFLNSLLLCQNLYSCVSFTLLFCYTLCKGQLWQWRFWYRLCLSLFSWLLYLFLSLDKQNKGLVNWVLRLTTSLVSLCGTQKYCWPPEVFCTAGLIMHYLMFWDHPGCQWTMASCFIGQDYRGPHAHQTTASINKLGINKNPC